MAAYSKKKKPNKQQEMKKPESNIKYNINLFAFQSS